MTTHLGLSGRISFLALSLWTVLSAPALAQQVSVRTAKELHAALQRAEPGSEILLLPGVYDGGIYIADRHGTEAAPIRVRGVAVGNPPIIRGGADGLKFSSVSHFVVENLVIEKATLNGLHIDDHGKQVEASHHVTLRGVTVRDIGQNGNFDGIKLSGLVDFELRDCRVENWAGQGIDMVGCRRGRIVGCHFDGKGTSSHGVQMKGGSRDIVVEECQFRDIKDRAVQIGGSTGLQFFRPEPQGFEAKDITVRDCRFCKGGSAVAFVNIDGAVFERNVIYRPQRYVVRILQEQTAPGFVPSRKGRFVENIVVWRNDELIGGVANVGQGTAPETFEFADNYWYREDFPQRSLPKGFPTPETGSVLGEDPKLHDAEKCDLRPLRSREAMREAARKRPAWTFWQPLMTYLLGGCAVILATLTTIKVIVGYTNRKSRLVHQGRSRVENMPSTVASHIVETDPVLDSNSAVQNWKSLWSTVKDCSLVLPVLAAVLAPLTWLAIQLPGMPYNIREVFATSTPLIAIWAFLLACLVGSASTCLVARMSVIDPITFLWLGPATIGGVALLLYGCLRFAIPLEAMDDFVGTPVLQWAIPEFERAVRFVMLEVGLLAAGTLGARSMLTPWSRFDLWEALLLCLLFACSYVVVVIYAATDNLVELVRPGNHVIPACCCALLIVIVGAVSAHWSLWMSQIASLPFRLRDFAALAVVTSTSWPLAWVLFQWGSNSSLEKYGEMFSATQFLLSVDREHYISEGWSLFFRFGLGLTAVMLLIVPGMTIAFSALSRRTRLASSMLRPNSAEPGWSRANCAGSEPLPNSSKRDVPVRSDFRNFRLNQRHYVALTVAFLFLAVYGSLVPFRFQPVPWDVAWDRFLEIRFLQLSVAHRADWVANVLLFIPLGYLANGAALVDGKLRSVRWIVAGLIASSALVLSAAIEFAQIWFPNRTVSQNDIYAETLGGFLGTCLWLSCGQRVTDVIRDFLRDRRHAERIHGFLWVYALGFFISCVLPLDLTISRAEIFDKYKLGRIELIPFSQRPGSPVEFLFEIATDVAVFVPLGYLMAIISLRQGETVRSVFSATALGFVVAGSIEFIQLLVYSRWTATSDVLLGTAGVACGAWLAGCQRAAARHSGSVPLESHSVRSIRLWALASLTYTILLAALFWYPYDFIRDIETIETRLREFTRIPFAALYAGTDFNAMSAVIRKGTWFLPLGVFVGITSDTLSRKHTSRWPVHLFAFTYVLLVSIAIEGGQVLLASKISDLTDVGICWLGSCFGLWAYHEVSNQ